MNYRPEIDGLRAVAVLAVIGFHAGLPALPGGFIGVDVFFVISGYLISSLILEQKVKQSFSLIHFYERRARRILPALFTVLFCCIPLAWMWLLPADMKSFSQSLVAISIFASNILFWRTSGYFDSTSELKPLMHTWSLSVEEQFYIIFPTLILLLWPLGKKWVLRILMILSLISLGTAQVFIISEPSPTFYLLPTRAWELLLGGVVALTFPQIKIAALNKGMLFTHHCLAFIGLALILYSLTQFSAITPWPSLYSLMPVIGVSLILLFAHSKGWVFRLLSHPFIVSIGLISYSAYLWHYPLFSFARHLTFNQPSALLLILLTGLTLLLSYASWKWIETPFRNSSIISNKTLITLGVIGSLFFIGFGLAGQFSKGFPARMQEESQYLAHFENAIPDWVFFTKIGLPDKYRMECDFYDVAQYRKGMATKKPRVDIPTYCYARNSQMPHSVFLWGDSHAQHLYYGLRETMPKDWQILQITTSGCEPKVDSKISTVDYCDYSNAFSLEAIANAKPDVVVVAQNLHHTIAKMDTIRDALLSIGVKKIIFVGPTPHWLTELPKLITQKFWPNPPNRTLVGINAPVQNHDRYLNEHFSNSEKSQYFSLIDELCNSSGCTVYFNDDKLGGISSWDYGHLSPIASYTIAKQGLTPLIIQGIAK